ncbi:hypothetical protein H9P43_009836 [Blastocladiella emersonii ATCC 22665]|nr:hypothetical protein H9P43_009836 [Blastocladiella emersonii ATCC 22665]
MTDRLPPNLLRLFAPRPPAEYLPPLDRDPAKRRGPTYSGVAHLMDQLRDHDSDYVPWDAPEERRQRLAEERRTAAKAQVDAALMNWKPHDDPNATADPFKTLFVGRLSHDTTEKTLRKEFEYYGPIKTIKVVLDQDGKSRGYAFIEFDRERDMTAAYKAADGIKLDGRRIVVDVERGRTVQGWRPRRLGGGLGHTRAGPKWSNQAYPGRDTSHLRPAGSHAGAASISESYHRGSGGYAPREVLVATNRGMVGTSPGATTVTVTATATVIRATATTVIPGIGIVIAIATATTGTATQ